MISEVTFSSTCFSQVWYDTADVMEAWDEILKAVDVNVSLAEMETFKHDLVDLTRQALQLKIDYMYQHVVQAYKNKDEQYLRYELKL